MRHQRSGREPIDGRGSRSSGVCLAVALGGERWARWDASARPSVSDGTARCHAFAWTLRDRRCGRLSAAPQRSNRAGS